VCRKQGSTGPGAWYAACLQHTALLLGGIPSRDVCLVLRLLAARWMFAQAVARSAHWSVPYVSVGLSQVWSRPWFNPLKQEYRQNDTRTFGSYLTVNRTRGLGGESPASNSGGPGSSPRQVMWDLWRTECHWGRFYPSTSVSPANSHSTDCSTLIIIYHPGLVQ
jgi:hypothetical protein